MTCFQNSYFSGLIVSYQVVFEVELLLAAIASEAKQPEPFRSPRLHGVTLCYGGQARRFFLRDDLNSN
jgi:hypothetical protein